MKSFEMFRMLSSCHSGVWRGILSVMDAFDLNIRFRVGSGEKILFWLNTWVGDKPLAN